MIKMLIKITSVEDDFRIDNGAEWAMCMCKRWIMLTALVKCHGEEKISSTV